MTTTYGPLHYVADFEIYRRWLDRWLGWTDARVDPDRCMDDLNRITMLASRLAGVERFDGRRVRPSQKGTT